MDITTIINGYGAFYTYYAIRFALLAAGIAVIAVCLLAVNALVGVHIKIKPVRTFFENAGSRIKPFTISLISVILLGIRSKPVTVVRNILISITAVILEWLFIGQILVWHGAPGPGIYYVIAAAVFAYPISAAAALIITWFEAKRFPDAHEWFLVLVVCTVLIVPFFTLLPLMAVID